MNKFMLNIRIDWPRIDWPLKTRIPRSLAVEKPNLLAQK